MKTTLLILVIVLGLFSCDGDKSEYVTVLRHKEVCIIDAYYIKNNNGDGLYYYQVLHYKDTCRICVYV